MDEVYASLAYGGAPLLRVPVCVSRALLVFKNIFRTPSFHRLALRDTCCFITFSSRSVVNGSRKNVCTSIIIIGL